MRNSGSLICACMVLLILSTTPSAQSSDADEESSLPDVGVLSDKQPAFSDTYPGRAPDGSKIFDISESNLSKCLVYYYKIHGFWPNNWSEVVSEGICQVPLVGYNNETIDPDDGTLDFYGDLLYDPVIQADGSVKIFRLHYRQGPHIAPKRVTPPKTYRVIFEVFSRDFPESEFSSYLQQDKKLKQFAMVGMLRRDADIYHMLYGYYPCTIIDLLDSGLAVYDQNSVNPLNSEPITGDGLANGILYDWIDENTIRLVHVEADGTIPEFTFSY